MINLLGVDFELLGDVHVFSAAENLGIDYVGDDGLIFPGKGFRSKARLGDHGKFRFRSRGIFVGHWRSP